MHHHEHHHHDHDHDGTGELGDDRSRGPRLGRRRRAFGEGPGRGWGGPGWGPPWGRRGPWGGGRGRARRGDVRAAALALLAERPMHGYEMIRELEARTDGAWKPSPGSVYPTLQLLEDEGLVVGTEEGGKRRFTLTDAGRAAVAEQTGPTPWEEVAGAAAGGDVELRDATFQVMAAARQLAVAGSDDQRQRGTEVLAEARRQLYGILAEGA